MREVASLLKDLEILAYDVEAAFHIARIHVALSRRGETNGVEDEFIAGIAVRRREPLVTRNLSRFTRVPGLKSNSSGKKPHSMSLSVKLYLYL